MCVFSDFAPNKIVTFYDKDFPWLTQYLKCKINWSDNIYQDYQGDDFIFLENVICKVSELISSRNNDYYNRQIQKLDDPKTSSKTYWSILKTFYNSKKVPLISPLLIKNRFLTFIFVISNFTECESISRLLSIAFKDTIKTYFY